MKKRIAFITHESPLATLGGVDAGGQVVYVDKLSKALADLGYDIDIFVRWEDSKMPQVVNCQKGIRIIHMKAGPVKVIPKEHILPFMQEFATEMERFMAEEEITYQLIHANYFMSGVVANELKKRLGIPFIIIFHALGKIRRLHQGAADTFGDERFPLEEQLVKDADHIIAECPQDREDLIYHYHANQDNISIIPCGFDPVEFYPLDKTFARMHLELSPDEPILLELGRLVPRKGIDTGIQALKVLQDTYGIKAKLLIVGGDSEKPDPANSPEMRRLQLVAEDMGVTNQVEFVGSRKGDILKYYYSAADVFIDTPWYEPFGLTPLESMACGTPVVGSEVGGVKFTVRDGETGFLVPAKDPETTAKKIATILLDSSLAEKMKEHAINRVNNFFTWAIIAQSVSVMYENLTFSGKERAQELHDFFSTIDTNFENLLDSVKRSKEVLNVPIAHASKLIIESLRSGNKVLLCGNGGSATDASHFAEELIARHVLPYRPALPAIALTADNSVLTAIGNDFSFQDIFSRQVEALGKPGDVLVCMSTSGNSQNVIQAIHTARQKDMVVIGLLGKDGGKIADLCDVPLIVPATKTQHIQEIHTNLLHTMCELIEKRLYAHLAPHPTTMVGMKQGKSEHTLSIKNEKEQE